MIKVLEEAIERLRGLTEPEQEDIASVLAALVGETREPYPLKDDERAAVQVGLDQAKRGEFVPDAQMDAFWRRNKA